MKMGVPETAIHTECPPWLAKVDTLIGTPAHLELANPHEFLCSVAGGPQSHEAVADAESRSMPTLLRWRMRWKQATWGVNGCVPRPGATAGSGTIIRPLHHSW
jgi:hypothetical protein